MQLAYAKKIWCTCILWIYAPICRKESE